MAWIEEQRTKTGFVSYQVTWRENGTKRRRTLRDRAEAEALRDSLQHLRRTRWGNPSEPVSIADKLRANAEFDDEGCWIWQGKLGSEGYAFISVGPGPRRLAHRVSYETFLRPIPDGLQIDHLCRNRACIYPLHLEPVTSRVNTQRSPITLASINRAKTHCPQGHPYDERNTYWSRSSGRLCRICQREAGRRYRARKAARRAA